MPHDQQFERVAHAYRGALQRLAAAYEPDAHEQEDLVQDILFALWRALPSFRGECSERTFVYRIAHNRGLTHACRRRPDHDRLDELPATQEPIDPAPRPEEKIAIAGQQSRLRDAIQRLPLAYRQVVMLMLEDLSHKE